MGAYIRTNGGVVPAKAAQFLHGPYRLPTIEVEVAAYMTSKTPVGTYRAPGRFEANFFRERLMDMAARDLGVDPVRFPAKELDQRGRLPYSIGRLVPYETETQYDRGGAARGLVTVALKNLATKKRRLWSASAWRAAIMALPQCLSLKVVARGRAKMRA